MMQHVLHSTLLARKERNFKEAARSIATADFCPLNVTYFEPTQALDAWWEERTMASILWSLRRSPKVSFEVPDN